MQYVSSNHGLNKVISLSQIPGYNLIHQPTGCSENGRLITSLKKGFVHNVRNLHTSSDIWECCFIDVFHATQTRKSLFAPSTDLHKITI